MQCKSMNVKRRGLLAGACFAALLVAGIAGSAYAADYTPVTDARLLRRSFRGGEQTLASFRLVRSARLFDLDEVELDRRRTAKDRDHYADLALLRLHVFHDAVEV